MHSMVSHRLVSCSEVTVPEMNTLDPVPEGPSTQYLRHLAPNTIKGRVLGTRVLKYLVLGPSGYVEDSSPAHFQLDTSMSSWRQAGILLG